MFRFRVGSIIQAIPIILHFVRLFRQWRVIYIHKIELDLDLDLGLDTTVSLCFIILTLFCLNALIINAQVTALKF